MWLAYPRIPANYHRPRYGKRADLVVVHTMESPEKPGTARGVANWFAGRLGPPPVASAHFCIGPDETIQCVPLDEQGAHAPGANSRSVGLEHVGRARQTTEEWADDASRKTLDRSAHLTAELCRVLSIPPKRLDAAAVKAGEAGICGHVDVTRAFPDKGHGHYDPGPNFPWDSYMAAVADELSATAAPSIAPKLDPRSLPVLRVGSTGEHVQLCQERLRHHAQSVVVDGVFGPATGSSVAAFQSSSGANPDGIVGAITWELLLRD